MSEIDEIKKRLDESAYMFGGENLAFADVEYLLSKLEVAENTLKWYSNIPHYDRRLSGGTSAVEADAGGRAREAIQQIRE